MEFLLVHEPCAFLPKEQLGLEYRCLRLLPDSFDRIGAAIRTHGTILSIRNAGHFIEINAFLSEQCFISLQSLVYQLVPTRSSLPSRGPGGMKDALHIVSDARIAWGLFVTPNFPVRATDAGVCVLCRWYTRGGVRRAHFEKQPAI